MNRNAMLESPPTDAKRLYDWTVGPRVSEWSERTEQPVLDSLEQSILQAQNEIRNIASQLNDLAATRDDLALSQSMEYKEEQTRLTILRERNANILQSLIKSRSIMNAGGVAVLLQGVLRQQQMTAANTMGERNVTPARRKLSDALPVVEQ